MLVNVIPTPKKIVKDEGVTTLPLAISCSVNEWDIYTDSFVEIFEKMFEKSIVKSEGGIQLVCDNSLSPKSYRIDSREGIVLSASDSEGILYALATLLQMVNTEQGIIEVEKAVVEDYPEKDYRTLMIDLAREWHPAHNVHKYIDVCFLLKIKYLHIHFIDDQRYTLPSKALPRITDGNKFYTYEEIATMREYAKSRGIIIIPEFESPGHAAVLNKNYPEIFANKLEGDGGSVVTENGDVITAKNVICAGNPKTIEAVKTLIKEICELFPETPYIHIGGDEANIKAWNYCTECKKYMQENNIEDEYELYSEFVGRVAKFVLDCGKTPIVWEGFPKNGVKHVPKETIVVAWESHYQMSYDLLEAGFKIINGSWKPLYIVPDGIIRWGVPEILDWNVYNWQHWWRKSEAHLNPINVTPTENVLGAQLSVWECTFDQAISRTMENLAALSERIWTVKRLWNEKDFNAAVRPTLTRIARVIQDK